MHTAEVVCRFLGKRCCFPPKSEKGDRVQEVSDEIEQSTILQRNIQSYYSKFSILLQQLPNPELF